MRALLSTSAFKMLLRHSNGAPIGYLDGSNAGVPVFKPADDTELETMRHHVADDWKPVTVVGRREAARILQRECLALAATALFMVSVDTKMPTCTRADAICFLEGIYRNNYRLWKRISENCPKPDSKPAYETARKLATNLKCAGYLKLLNMLQEELSAAESPGRRKTSLRRKPTIH